MIPEQKGRGKAPIKAISSVTSIPVSAIAADDSLPWECITLMERAKGLVITQIKYCRIIELQNGKDADELWLYIRKYEDGTIKYAFANAPADIEICELHHVPYYVGQSGRVFRSAKVFLEWSIMKPVLILDGIDILYW